MRETPAERHLRIGAALADRGVFVPWWLLREAISSTAMSHDDVGTYSVDVRAPVVIGRGFVILRRRPVRRNEQSRWPRP